MTELATVDSPVGAASSRLHPGQNGERKQLPPADILEWANIWERPILAWTKLDPSTSCIHVGWYSCDDYARCMIFCPPFWPQLVLLAPWLCDATISKARGKHHEYWILTPTHLKIVTKSPGETGGCCMPVHRVQSIALVNIDLCDVQTTRIEMNVPECCDPLLPQVHVTSSDSDGSTQYASGVALLQCRDFVRQVVRQRDAVKRSYSRAESRSFVAAVMERGNEEAIESTLEARIQKIVEHRDKGGLSLAQFEHERQAIIDSM